MLRAAAIALAVLALPPAARADDAAVLYDPSSVAVIDVELSAEARQALLDEPREYAPATVTVTLGDRTVGPQQGEVKLKGKATFRTLDRKAAFNLKFPKSDRLLGLRKMTLNNMVQDASLVHETLGYEILRAAQVPAPRTGFAYVRVDGQPYGLYLDLEAYDSVSLARLFASTGHLYEADDYGVDVQTGGAGAYEVDEGDEDDRSDLEALIAAANAPAEGWYAGMAGVADRGEMVRLWAAEQYLGHWDGYSVTAGSSWPNNYYLHGDGTGRFSMLASGLDQTFVRSSPLPGQGGAVLVTRCREDDACRQAFRDALGAVAAAADELEVGTRLAALAAVLAPWRGCAGREQADDQRWREAVLGTLAFVRARRDDVAAYLGAPAPAPLAELALPGAVRCPLDPEPPAETHTEPAAGGVLAEAAQSSRSAARLAIRVTHRRNPYRFTTRGALRPAAGCTGQVVVTIRAGARVISRRRAALDRGCRFTSSARFRDPRRRKVTVVASFGGNGVLLPAESRRVAVRLR
jgi:hypothetical protein